MIRTHRYAYDDDDNCDGDCRCCRSIDDFDASDDDDGGDVGDRDRDHNRNCDRFRCQMSARARAPQIDRYYHRSCVFLPLMSGTSTIALDACNLAMVLIALRPAAP